MLKGLIQECVKDPNTYKIGLTLDDNEGNAYLKFRHESEYAKSQILKLRVKQLEDEDIQKRISYRISATTQKSALIANRLKDINEILQKTCETAQNEQNLNLPVSAFY